LYAKTPTVLRFAQDKQISKKHGRTPQAFAAAFLQICGITGAGRLSRLYFLKGLTAPKPVSVWDDF